MNILLFLKRGAPDSRPDGVSAEIVRGHDSIEEAREAAKFATASWEAVDLADLPESIGFEGHALGGLNARRGA